MLSASMALPGLAPQHLTISWKCQSKADACGIKHAWHAKAKLLEVSVNGLDESCAKAAAACPGQRLLTC